MNLADIDPAENAFRKILVYGPPKSGKTKLVGTLAERFKLDWIDLENGYKTLFQLPKELQKNINIIRVPDSREFPIAGQMLWAVTKGNKVKVCEKHGNANCPLCLKDPGWEIELNNQPIDRILVIDSATQLTMSILNRMMKDAWAKDPETKPEWDNYREMGNRLNGIFGQIQAGRYHCIVISHEVEIMNDKTKETKVVPVAGTTNFSKNFGKFFDDIVYLEIKDKRHQLGSNTTYKLNTLTGSRAGIDLEKLTGNVSLIPFFEQPNLSKAVVGTVGKP